MVMSVATAANLLRRRIFDRLAKEGTTFTQFYVASPVCSPSRTGCLTGMYPARWRITNFLQTREGNRASEQADFLDPKGAVNRANFQTRRLCYRPLR